LTTDGGGNFYGTTAAGGYTGGSCDPAGCGTVFKLKASTTGWILTTLYKFTGGSDGQAPQSRVIFGHDGRLYGTTASGGGFGAGTVFSLTRPPSVCKSALCPWTETVLHRFTGGRDGGPTAGDLVFDQVGNVYGATTSGGSFNRGLVYELTPSGGSWVENVLHNFSQLPDGLYPGSGVVFDNAGNLYGTTEYGGSDFGTVYELTPSGGGWTESILYTFTGGSDGYYPVGGLTFDQSGSLYGTTQGPQGCCGGGTIFQLTPSGDQWTLTTLFNFPQSFGWPYATLTIDAAGNFYGTTSYNDGASSAGNVFKLSHEIGSWTYLSLHNFTGGADGGGLYGSAILDADGDIYGTASGGGAYFNCDAGCGTVWKITP
jgi:uncharacterized repeat protein (TIGR03803 family)